MTQEDLSSCHERSHVGSGLLWGLQEGADLRMQDRFHTNPQGATHVCAGYFGFWFDPASLQYLDKPNLKPTRVVEYSNRDV